MTDHTPDPVAPSRVIYIAPESRAGGVGHYADVFVEALRGRVPDVVEIRHPGPGEDTVRALIRRRRAIRGHLADRQDAVVHSEISGGSVESFWPTAFLERRHGPVHNSMTVHDPPGLVWWPLRTRLLSRSKWLNHGVHVPTVALARRSEKWVAGTRTLVALSRMGARAAQERYPRASVHHIPHFVVERAEIPAAVDRPRAVGLFGLVYRGKGFDQVAAIRAALDPSIALRIAGRGTESLPAIDGVEILGGLDGTALDDFFASIRALVVPYGNRSQLNYGPAYPASGAVAHSIAYLTPMVSTAHGALAEMRDDGGAVVIDSGDENVASALAIAAGELVDDDDRLRRLSAELSILRTRRSPANVVAQFTDLWAR
ncbi:hypothetical protein [Williamsia sp.]|uniref:hypothetical protein n=1 Tax=Williamsia sp. TaxID=1872085 RepID=UPI001A353659|nr:hypothetical protein [Williamsia sp.]MBJ7289138.1 hypothetical protein [Williamsia sp.]